MHEIKLQQTLPQVFADLNRINSDVWHKNITFKRGEFYLIEAASGTGKSSLCSYLYGYRNDYQGIVTYDDLNIKQYTDKDWLTVRRSSISMLFQDLRLFGELSSIDNILIKNKLTHHKSKKEIIDLLEQVGLKDKINSKVEKLSFGQQQRVAFIRALCQPFDFIILDEPISHLDDVNSDIISRILLTEATKQQAGVIVTSIGKHIYLPYNSILRL